MKAVQQPAMKPAPAPSSSASSGCKPASTASAQAQAPSGNAPSLPRSWKFSTRNGTMIASATKLRIRPWASVTGTRPTKLDSSAWTGCISRSQQHGVGLDREQANQIGHAQPLSGGASDFELDAARVHHDHPVAEI